jgi:hypothetical protein
MAIRLRELPLDKLMRLIVETEETHSNSYGILYTNYSRNKRNIIQREYQRRLYNR